MPNHTFSLNAEDPEEIQVRQWLPETQPRAIVHVLHGMAEHSARYAALAEHLNQAGIGVYAHDHRGHGELAQAKGQLGHFADEDGWELVLKDVATVQTWIRQQHDGRPIFILGHSMGSFITQAYMMRAGKNLAGAIIVASNGKVGPMLSIGRFIAKLETLRQGVKGKSKLIHALSFGDFNRKFKPVQTEFDWLSRNHDNVNRYIADPLCGFMCTNQFWMDFLGGLQSIEKAENLAKIPKALPLLVLAGTEDPVGKQGKGVKKLLETYSEIGLTAVESSFYPGARHEILNETNKSEVFSDILSWLERQSSLET